MDDLTAISVVTGNLTLSPLLAISRLSEIMNTKEILEYDQAIENQNAGRDLSRSESDLKNQIYAACVVAVNYFTMVETLLEKDVVDADFVLEKLGHLVRRLLPLIERVNPQSALNWDSLRDLDGRAARYYEKDGTEKSASGRWGTR